ncbi:hypothetical protein QZH41_001189, partial [Actinostola sp. cb2023]
KTTGKDEARKLVPKVKEALDKVTDDKSSQSYRLAESSYNYVQGEVAFADFTCGMSSQSHFEAGLQCHNQCLQTRRELLGDHNETVYCLNAIGNYYMELKDHQKALDYYTEILDTKQRLTGGKVQLDAPVYSNQIACVHEEMGKKFRDESRESRQPRRKQLYERAKEEFQHAISKYQEALDLERKLHISGYANTAAFYRNMSTSYSFLEEYDQALVCAKKALSIRKKVLGTDANTLRSYYQVGIVYEKLGNHDKALKYVYKAYNMELSLPPGERSRVKLRVTDKIGNLCGDLDEAKEYDSRSVLADDDVLVQPLPPRFLKTENFFCGPVLHIDKSTSTDILEPVAVCFPHPLSWHGDNTPRCGEVRVLHRARDNWNDEWLDITDDISTCMDQDMVSIEVKHFSINCLVSSRKNPSLRYLYPYSVMADEQIPVLAAVEQAQALRSHPNQVYKYLLRIQTMVLSGKQPLGRIIAIAS